MYTPFTDNYRCWPCGVKQCKLWRQYMVTTNNVNLLCASCALRDQEVESMPDANGKRVDSIEEEVYLIGNLVPAIPREDSDTFWGYFSVPVDGFQWWQSLPTSVTPQNDKKDIIVNEKEQKLNNAISELADLMSSDGGTLASIDPDVLLNRVAMELRALRADLVEANVQRTKDEQDLWCLRESFKQLAERAPEICRGATHMSTVAGAIDKLNRIFTYTAELKAELNKQKDSLIDSSNSKKYVVYYSADPLPINAPLEYFTETGFHVANLVGTFEATDRATAVALACESAEKQWGWLGAGGYFAAFLIGTNTTTNNTSLHESGQKE